MYFDAPAVAETASFARNFDYIDNAGHDRDGFERRIGEARFCRRNQDTEHATAHDDVAPDAAGPTDPQPGGFEACFAQQVESGGSPFVTAAVED